VKGKANVPPLIAMKPDKINGWEIWLVIYASGFALDKFATVLGKHDGQSSTIPL
jgi:hypothetical protein